MTTLTATELRTAFRPRKCLACEAQITPSERTDNPATARRINTCSKACKQKLSRLRRTPEQITADAAAAHDRYQRWYANPAKRQKHIARTVAARQARRSKD